MQWHKIGRILAVCGVLMVTIGVSALPAQGAEMPRQTQPLLAPSPRPTLGPERRGGDGVPSAPATGRITGTVIDQTTGAPMPGVLVDIGGTLVTSDANGNYDLWVLPGSYTVALVLTPEVGTPSLDPQVAEVAADQTTVLHLNLRTPLAPSATPVAPSATALPVKPAPPLESRVRPSNAARPPAAPRLPRTSEQDSNAWLWVAFGSMLLMGGVALEYGRSRRLAVATARVSRARTSYDNARLLAGLLASTGREAQPQRKRAAESELLLAALLAADAKEE